MQGQEDKVFTDVLNDINQQIAQNYEQLGDLSAFMQNDTTRIENVNVEYITPTHNTSLSDSYISRLTNDDSRETTTEKNNLIHLNEAQLDELKGINESKVHKAPEEKDNSGYQHIINTLDQNFNSSMIQEKDNSRETTIEKDNSREVKTEKNNLIRLTELRLDQLKEINENTSKSKVDKAPEEKNNSESDTGYQHIINTLDQNFKSSMIQEKDDSREAKIEKDNLMRLNEAQLDALEGINENTSESKVGKASKDDEGGGLGGLFSGLGNIFGGGGLKAAARLLTRIGGPLAAVGAFLSFADGFRNASDIVGKDDLSMIERIGAGGAKLISDFVNLFTNIANFFLPENLQLGNLDPAEVYRMLSNVFGKIMEYGAIFFNWMEDIFIAPFREMIGRLASAWEGDSITERIWNFTSQLVRELIMWPINLMGRLYDWWTGLDLHTDIVNGFKDFGSWLWETITGIPGMLMDKLTDWVTGWAESLSEWAPMNIVRRIGSMLPWPLNMGDSDDSGENIERPDRSMFSPSRLVDQLSSYLPWPLNRGGGDDDADADEDSGGWFSSARNAVSNVFSRSNNNVSAQDLQPEPTIGSRAEAVALDNSERTLRRQQNRAGYEQAADGAMMQQNQNGTAPNNTNNTVVTNNNMQNTIMSAPISGRNTRSYSRASYEQRGAI